MMSAHTTLTIPQDVLDSARLTAEEAKQELALSLYAGGRLSIGKARELAAMSLWSFRHLLTSRHIPVHYGLDELEADLSAFDSLKRSC